LRPETRLASPVKDTQMTPKQRTDYVVQIMASLVQSTGEPIGLSKRIPDVIKLVDQIDAALQKRPASKTVGKSSSGK
jgi:hypothetical protein